ncbi:MAG: hypothetical protein HC897_15585 [Thermoanaerobaculia bacterium]|nr:hypothetical protein [Thermoanaerobaculia bacterium]
MYAVYTLSADELDDRFLDALKATFRGRQIEIAVSDAAQRADDETAHLLSSPANRHRLLEATENVAHGRGLVEVDLSKLGL